MESSSQNNPPNNLESKAIVTSSSSCDGKGADAYPQEALSSNTTPESITETSTQATYKSKDGLIRMLLQTATPSIPTQQQGSTPNQGKILTARNEKSSELRMHEGRIGHYNNGHVTQPHPTAVLPLPRTPIQVTPNSHATNLARPLTTLPINLGGLAPCSNASNGNPLSTENSPNVGSPRPTKSDIETTASTTKHGCINIVTSSISSKLVPSILSTAVPTSANKFSKQPAENINVHDENPTKFIYQISESAKQIGMAEVDHCYSRPWNWRPDGVRTHPTKSIFLPKVARQPSAAISKGERSNELDEIIEVDQIDETSMTLPYHEEKSNKLMEECERFGEFANPDALSEDEMDDWEEQINKDGWLPRQNKLFVEIMKILHADRLARLTLKGHSMEAIQRRNLADKTAKRFRQKLAGVMWDTKTTQWLHNTLTDVLPKPYLASYLDVLQTLKIKLPVLVDKMVSAKVHDHALGVVSNEGLRILLKRPWDLTDNPECDHDLKMLPGDPIIVLTTAEPYLKCGHNSESKRVNRFTAMWRRMVKDEESLIEVWGPKLETHLHDYRTTIQQHQSHQCNIEKVSEFDVDTTQSPSSNAVSTEENISIVDEHDTMTKYIIQSFSEQTYNSKKSTMSTQYINEILTKIISTVKSQKQKFPNRPIILAGWGASAALNCHAASMAHQLTNTSKCFQHPNTALISSNVCLGFPFTTLDGSRGEFDDPLFSCQVPCIFVVGQQSNKCNIDDLEDTRKHIPAKTYLIVVGGADAGLRLSKQIKDIELVTQDMADMCVMEEVRSFLVGVLVSS